MSTPRCAATFYWKTPTTIVISFIGGVALAVGHHLFYRSLNEQIVEHASFSQQVNTGIGTALAFLVRHALMLAVGASYWQIFWATLSRKNLSVGVIDSLAGILTAVQEFTNTQAIKAQPLLVLLALLSWLLPLPAIVPPGTLSVQAVLANFSTLSSIPALDFASGKMVKVESSTLLLMRAKDHLLVLFHLTGVPVNDFFA